MGDCSLYCLLLENKIKALDRIADVIEDITTNIAGQGGAVTFTGDLVTLHNILVSMLVDANFINFVTAGTPPAPADADQITLCVNKCNSCVTTKIMLCTLSFLDGEVTPTVTPLSGVTTSTTYGDGYCDLVSRKIKDWVEDAKAILEKVQECCCTA